MKKGSPCKRAIRRHHHERLLKQWVKRLYKIAQEDYQSVRSPINDEEIQLGARYRTITPHPCSCPHCGNWRRHFGERTVQERRLGIG